MSFYVGEALVGKDGEISHIDLLIGTKEGPVGEAFCQALANQKKGHTNLLAVLTPNLAVKPSTVMIPKFTMKDLDQAVQMFGPAQEAVAKAVADSIVEGQPLAKIDVDDYVIVCGVFIHKDAKDNKLIYDYNYEATKMAIASAMANEPTKEKVIAGKDEAKHPFRGFDA